MARVGGRGGGRVGGPAMVIVATRQRWVLIAAAVVGVAV